MDGLADALLSGAEVWVETTVTPPMRVDLTPSGQPPGALEKFLKPKVTLRRQGTDLLRIAPHGEPGEGYPVALLLAGALALLLLLFSAALRS